MRVQAAIQVLFQTRFRTQIFVFGVRFVMSEVNIASPFVLHMILECPAVIAFGLFPSATLRSEQPEAHPVIRQYALLLFTSILIAACFASQPFDTQAGNIHVQRLEQQVAGALALYHIGPMMRAASKITDKEISKTRGFRMMPFLHLLSHGVCGMALAGRACRLW